MKQVYLNSCNSVIKKTLIKVNHKENKIITYTLETTGHLHIIIFLFKFMFTTSYPANYYKQKFESSYKL